jgi:uncharacterized membrane protein
MSAYFFDKIYFPDFLKHKRPLAVLIAWSSQYAARGFFIIFFGILDPSSC